MNKQNKPPKSALLGTLYAGATQQDGKEVLWAELETLLRRCIRGLNLLSESTNAVVRAHTESLRRATHDGLDLQSIRDDLQQLADEIGAAVASSSQLPFPAAAPNWAKKTRRRYCSSVPMRPYTRPKNRVAINAFLSPPRTYKTNFI